MLYKSYSCHTCCNHTSQKIMDPRWNLYRASTLSQGFSANSHKIFIRDITYQICQFPQSGISPCVNLDLILWHLTSNAEIFYSVVGSILLKKIRNAKWCYCQINCTLIQSDNATDIEKLNDIGSLISTLKITSWQQAWVSLKIENLCEDPKKQRTCLHPTHKNIHQQYYI